MATSTPRTTTTVQTGTQCVVSKNIEPDEKLLTDIFEAYYVARSNKRNTYSQIRFERNLSENLIRLYEEIRSRKYRVGRSVCFIVKDKVKREIFAASFRDRIVHHLLFNYLNPILEPTFIEDSYSCRKGKGTLYGARRMFEHMKSAVAGTGACAYVLKLDIQSYFLHINKDILYRMIAEKMDSADQMYDTMVFLLRKVIYNDPTYRCRVKGSRSDWDDLPKSKSLFYSPHGCGLPIGNLTSQLFSNVYLSVLDDYITEHLGFKRYGRYVDDFCIIHSDKKRLLDAIPKIRSFLKTSLGLQLHPKKVYFQPCTRGATFVGYYITPSRMCVDRRTVRHMRLHILRSLSEEVNPYLLYSILRSVSVRYPFCSRIPSFGTARER